jgi:hypothetical protein
MAFPDELCRIVIQLTQQLLRQILDKKLGMVSQILFSARFLHPDVSQ